MRGKTLLFLGLFALVTVALSGLVVGAETPSGDLPTVKLWAFYDKDVNGYPTGWTYLDPVITDPMDWQQDSPWLSFPSPHYRLYGTTWGSNVPGALVQEGDFGPGVAEIPLADGAYIVQLSAPPGGWQLTTDAWQQVFVYQGNVYVHMLNDNLWYGDKVLVGIVDGAACSATLAVDDAEKCCYIPSASAARGDTQGVIVIRCDVPFYFTARGLTPDGPVRYWAVGPSTSYGPKYSDASGTGSFETDFTPMYVGDYTFFVEDLVTGCIASVDFSLLICR